MEDELSELLQQGIIVHNAGLVILNSYFKILFDRLGITENFTFKSTKRGFTHSNPAKTQRAR